MKVKVGEKYIGENAPCFIVAEIGINFNGSLDIAKKLIGAAANAGCDAVKFQMFKAKYMYPKSAGKLKWHDGTKKYSYDIYNANKRFELPEEWLPKLLKYSNDKGIIFFTSVFDEHSADLVERYNPIYKIASFAITHFPLLRHVAKKGKPMIFSTGTATMTEISDAYNEIKDINDNIIITHCVSEYPVSLENVNLITIDELKKQFPEAIIGYSDHSMEPIEAPVAATVLGVKVIEKHITLDRGMNGPDHFFALEPDMLKEMVNAIRETESKIYKGEIVEIDDKLLGDRNRRLTETEKYSKKFCRRSVMTKRPVKKDELLTEENLVVLRHGNKKEGLHPKYYSILIEKHKKAAKNLEAEHVLEIDDIKKE